MPTSRTVDTLHNVSENASHLTAHASRSICISHVLANIYKCLTLLSNQIFVDRTNTRHKQLQTLPNNPRKSKAQNTYNPAPTRTCTRSKSPLQLRSISQTLRRLVVNSPRCVASRRARYVQNRARRQVSPHGAWALKTRCSWTTIETEEDEKWRYRRRV
jgi:hypothetical protein